MTEEATAVEGILWAILSLTALKTLFVVNGIWDITSGGKHVAGDLWRAAGMMSFTSPRARRTSAPSSLSENRASRPSSKFRSVHKRLLLMHFLAILAQLASTGQYVMQITDAACVVAHRVMMASLVLFDGTTLVFLLAKTRVTNDVLAGSTQAPKGWEHAVRRFSLFWAWICLPVTAVLCAVALPAGVNHEDGGCHGAIESFNNDDNTTLVFFVAFTTGKLVLILELMLLLVLFIKPLYDRGNDGLYSIRPRHRRTVLRNIACTVGVVAVQLAETVVVDTVVYHKGGAEKVERSADAAAIIQVFLTLCLTETTIPLGFTSCFASARRKSPRLGSSGQLAQKSLCEARSNQTAKQLSSPSRKMGGKTANASVITGSSRVSLGAPGHARTYVVNEELKSALSSSARRGVLR